MDIEKLKKNMSPLQLKELEEGKKKIGKQLFQKLQQRKQEIKEIKKQIALKGRKKFIEDSMTSYKAYYNAEYIDHCKYILKLRKLQANKYASSSGNEFRLLFKLPANLYKYLHRFLEPAFPENNKESRWFAKRYPEFCVAEKI